MATAREVRRLAFQALFQLDAREGASADAALVRQSLDDAEGFTPAERDRAFRMAVEAYAVRKGADTEFAALAPAWPAHRQAAVDRALLRLAHWEITGGKTPPKAAVNEAVELAKAFSTEKSPSFINGLLDKVLKRVLAERAAAGGGAPGAGEADAPAADAPAAGPAASAGEEA